ncbi:MAG: hypothetical protein V3V82_04515 [Acidimicrobiia bacterium]
MTRNPDRRPVSGSITRRDTETAGYSRGALSSNWPNKEALQPHISHTTQAEFLAPDPHITGIIERLRQAI